MADASEVPAAAAAPAPATEALPKLTPAEFRVYNRMAEHMDQFHNHFRGTWQLLYGSCASGQRLGGMSVKQFLGIAEQFCSQLSLHHGIEEMHIFPVLAKKMPAFRQELDLLSQHQQIHAGMDRLEEYIAQCRGGEIDFQMSAMKEIMDSFGAVLLAHLDDEVKQLGAENMRKYWTLQEMKAMPM